jgi:hypothetical protein
VNEPRSVQPAAPAAASAMVSSAPRDLMAPL